MNSVVRAIAVAVAASLVSLFFFSPRLLVFTEEAPGSYEWTRGLSFIEQLDGQPLEKVEPALRHRLLPIYTARVLGLQGHAALALGWVGVLLCLACTNLLLGSLGLPGRIDVSATFLLASTSAVITSFGWLGIFDCWWVFALILVAIAPQWWMLGVAALSGPWIDERFLIGLPAAFAARWCVYGISKRSAANTVLLLALAVLPYLAWRIYSLLHSPGDVSGNFLSAILADFVVWLRMVPHGWWMAYRLGWIFLLLPLFLPNASGVKPWQLVLCCLPVAFAAAATAADITRSAMVLAPFMLVGVVIGWRNFPRETTRWVPWVAAANFLVPYIHVVYNKLESVHPLPWEVIRLLKKVA